jgi:hypothetical protein
MTADPVSMKGRYIRESSEPNRGICSLILYEEKEDWAEKG